MTGGRALVASTFLLLLSPSVGAQDASSPPPASWARKTLARLTLAEKVGQMIGVRADGLMAPAGGAEAARLKRQVTQLRAGTVVVFEAEASQLPAALNELQAQARVPLLVAADLERGVSFRIRRGVVPLPYAMAIGATRSEEAARFAGEVTAREGRALGIHWAFAPVVDVNNNPDNPVINIRSYGEDPALVARLARAFVLGARSGGLLTTAKHFPGHGDTATDSHLHWPPWRRPRERLNAVELLPFRSVVEAGVDWVMTGHIAAPALDPTRAPATLSSPIADVLRQRPRLLAASSSPTASTWRECAGAWTGEAAVRAVQAGADVILLPPKPEVAARALVAAVGDGRLTEARIDASVLRILETQGAPGPPPRTAGRRGTLARGAWRGPKTWRGRWRWPRASITVVRNEGGVLPLRARRPLRLLHLVLSSDARNQAMQGIPGGRASGPERRRGDPDPGTRADRGDVGRDPRSRARRRPTCWSPCSCAGPGPAGTAGHARAPRAARCARSSARAARSSWSRSAAPTCCASSPRCPSTSRPMAPRSRASARPWAPSSASIAVAGKLPVTLPGLYAYGHGIEIPGRPAARRSR